MASPEQFKYPIKCHACVPTRDFGNGAKTLMRRLQGARVPNGLLTAHAAGIIAYPAL